MAEIIEFPINKENAFRSKLIDALLDIRLTLSIKKITSEVIMKQEFRKILNEAKEKQKELEVKNALEDVFNEYFEIKETKEENNKSLSIDEMQNIIDNEVYQDKGNDMGNSKVLTGNFGKNTEQNTSSNAD